MIRRSLQDYDDDVPEILSLSIRKTGFKAILTCDDIHDESND